MATATDTLPDDPAELKAYFLKELARKDRQIGDLRSQMSTLIEALHLERQRHYGTSSEKNLSQQALFDEAEQESETPPLPDVVANTSAAPTIPKKKTARKALPPELPRIERVHDLPENERVCTCGCALNHIGDDISEQLDIIPATVQVIKHVRRKYACEQCENGVKTAPRPAVLLPKAIASGNTMAYVITAKYADGMPLYRLSDILKRYNIELPRQTLSESVIKTASQIEPLIQCMRNQLLASNLIYMDETPVQVLNEPDKTPQSRSYMWVQKGGPPGETVVQFNYDPSRSTAVPDRLLAGFTGTLMTDGYKPYRTAAATHKLTHLCCWAHARRKFVEAQKAQPKGKSGKADMAISLIAKLYAVEKQHRDSDAATRHRNRETLSKPALLKLRAWLDKTALQVPPGGALGKAVHYTLEYWQELSHYVKNGQWPIDNNTAENAIRPFVIGRKAWLFSQSQRGATASANLYSLIETAKANQVEPYQYLCWLFDRLPQTPSHEMDRLLPWNMNG